MLQEEALHACVGERAQSARRPRRRSRRPSRLRAAPASHAAGSPVSPVHRIVRRARSSSSARSLPTTTPVMSENVSVAGSRPAASQASTTRRAPLAELVGACAYVVLYSSAKRTAGPTVPRLGGAADDQRWVRRCTGRGRALQLLERVVLAREGERVLRPLPVDDLELLGEELEARRHVVEREAVGAMLALVPAGAEPELDAAARDVVGRACDLGELGRVPERRRRHHRPEPDARRDARAAR